MTLDGDIYSEMKEASNSLTIIFYCDIVKRRRPNEHGLALNYSLFFLLKIFIVQIQIKKQKQD